MVVKMDIITLLKLHKTTFKNKELLDTTNKCACCSCNHFLKTSDIKEWTDDALTAICPLCGVDAIIPITVENPITEDDLEKLYKYYFINLEKESKNNKK